MRNICADGSGNGFPRREFDRVPESVHAAQNEADHVHNPYDHTDDNDDAQRVELGLLPVIAGNDGVQQVINVAAMNLAYIKLHSRF
jgi:hypothetical protein